MSINFSSLQGLTIPEGEVTQIADANGNVLWSGGVFPGDIGTGLEFASSGAFCVSVGSPGWDGTMEYCNGKEWKTWNGSPIYAAESNDGYALYIRGIGNTKVTGSSRGAWFMEMATGVECNGNIEKLLDYATVQNGQHPTMAADCYCYLFSIVNRLTKAPLLPATTLTNNCYREMFMNCTELTDVPSLPAGVLVDSCYRGMFYGCTSLKLSATQTSEYTKAYKIPAFRTGSIATNSHSLTDMFAFTGGTFTGTPGINTTYYLHESNSIVQERSLSNGY